MSDALRLVEAHESADQLDDFERRLAAALVSGDARSEALPTKRPDEARLGQRPLVVALDCLGVAKALVVTRTVANVDAWGSRFTWTAAPKGHPKSYGHSDDDHAVHGGLFPHHIVTLRNLVKHCEHWEEQLFDLVVFDGVDAARGLDWLSTRPRRVWWLTDLDVAAETPAEVLARTGALPQPRPGARQRLSPLAEHAG